ncbi:MAG: D-amino acid dehydrogenase [Alphaproteobacteria bacterium]|nr:D-amino acid dehydrogenase [Alphaproteobacteria bacterium]
MRILVLGAGLAGVTAAHFLARDGHEVEVVDRQSDAASETSYANAGMVTPGHAFPWGNPNAPKILLRSLFKGDQALRLKLVPDLQMWRWGLKFLAQCTAERATINTIRKARLCVYSQKKLHEVAEETGIQYHAIRKGCFFIYREQEAFDRGVARMKILQDLGIALTTLDPAGVVATEPALADAKDKIAGAIFAPNDESGDSRLFTRKLAERLQGQGHRFRYDTTITRFRAEHGRITGVETSAGLLTADAYVLSLASESPKLVRRMGIDLPVYPVKGYSLTLPIRPENQAPTIAGVDEGYLVAFARMGNELRLTATAEFSGYNTDHQPSDFDGMIRLARDLFPNGADFDNPKYWACLRPMTPEGTPIVGRSRYENLWINTGHGHMGWTMSCGTAQALSDLVAGRKPELDLTGMEVPT